jgi:site-specific DNA-methyltransferase (adenine-specific)
MFSFAGDTVLDPFVGTGSTTEAAIQAGRNSIGVEIDSEYLKMAQSRVARACSARRLFGPSGASLHAD